VFELFYHLADRYDIENREVHYGEAQAAVLKVRNLAIQRFIGEIFARKYGGTLECSFDPRCLYCNQVPVPCRVGPEGWRSILEQVASPVPPYVYLTGGDPLLLEEAVWGDDGLVAFATRLGCAVNINTNAPLITPRVALQLVKSGLAKVHVSMDSVDPQVQAELLQGTGRAEAVWRGIFNLQMARELMGAKHPLIHINCVLTRRNLFLFPELLRYLLEVRKVPPAGADGKTSQRAALDDFAFHLIPVGGSENVALRPTQEEWKRFYTETWEVAEQIWQDYQTALDVPQEERKALTAQVPFANPFSRVDHRMTLEEYCLLNPEKIAAAIRKLAGY
jgi:hypothetical protein